MPAAVEREGMEQCPAAWVEGIDVFDGQGVIDWSAVAAAGVRFAFIKATQGTYDVQETFAANWEGAGRAGLARSAYHFFDPTEDGQAQAAAFLSVVGPASPGDLPPMVDLECPDGDASCLYPGASGVAPAGDISRRLGAFLSSVEEALAAAPIVYTFGSYFAVSGVEPNGLARYPLALAAPSARACIEVPAPWSQAAFWQYSWTGSVAGIESAVDRDRFLGTFAELQALTAVAGADLDASAGAPADGAAPISGPPVVLGAPGGEAGTASAAGSSRSSVPVVAPRVATPPPGCGVALPASIPPAPPLAVLGALVGVAAVARLRSRVLARAPPSRHAND